MKEQLSVLIMVKSAEGSLTAVHRAIHERLDELGPEFEMIYLLGVSDQKVLDEARALHAENPGQVRVLQFAPGVGEAGMLTAGLERAHGEILLSVPAKLETDLAELPQLLEAVQGGTDVAIACRTSVSSSRLQSRLFNRILSFAAGTSFTDVASSTRAIRRQVIDEIALYGEYHRYLPLLAERLGFAVKEIPAASPSSADAPVVHTPKVYFLRALDVLSVFFISRFTRYPLRLFGGVGSAFAAVGAVLLVVIGVQRFLGTPLANRPLLVLGTLLVGLGVQAFTIGLLGELILFFQARNVRDYRIVAIYDASTDQNSV